MKRCLILTLLVAPLVTVDLAAAAPLAPPAELHQRDAYGDVPPGELVGTASLTLAFTVIGMAGEKLTPEVELRPIDEPFSSANVTVAPLVASGAAQPVRILTPQPLRYAGYHWRVRMTGADRVSPWVAFHDHGKPAPAAEATAADFYYLYEPLSPDENAPTGFDALVRIARLPLLVPGVETRQVSSFDRAEGNIDGGSGADGLESFLYREGEAEVILEAKGPGQINRIWFAECNDAAFFLHTRLQFFFDGAPEPSLEIKVVDMMSGQHPPFVRPLVLDPERSSGGWISYVPIPFHDGVKVRIIGPHVHYQVTYQQLADAAGVETFTGREDYRLAQYLWGRVGHDPKPSRGNEEITAKGGIAPGDSVVIADLTGAGVVQRLSVQLPQLLPSIVGDPMREESVRILRQGASDFSLRPTRAGVPTRVRVRRDCCHVPQTAAVRVNGSDTGQWSHDQEAGRYCWCEDTFDLTRFVAAAAKPLALHIASGPEKHPWVEAHYWLDQEIDGSWQPVDELDIGDVRSERAHAYRVTGDSEAAVLARSVEPVLTVQPRSEALLDGLRLRVHVDDGAEPFIDAPLAAFCGSAVGENSMASLMAGIRGEDHTLYSYWPMPFGSRLRVELYNGSTETVEDYRAAVAFARRAYPAVGERSGYFAVVESLSRPTTTDVDHPFLAVGGSGRLVGVHLVINDSQAGLLEGDERFHADGMLTPVVRGTGTEDMFNSSWYYNRGRSFSPVHGTNPTNLRGFIDQYRWYVSDSIPFVDGIHGGIEHGFGNESNANYSSWTYLYLAPRSAVVLQDTVDLGDSVSLLVHETELLGLPVPYEIAGRFEGDDDSVLTATGYRLPAGGAMTATLRIDPHARVVALRRRYDQSEHSERLHVWVDGVPAGEWVDGGRNTARVWRESTFFIPPALTRGRDRIVVRLEPADGPGGDDASVVRLTALSTYRQP